MNSSDEAFHVHIGGNGQWDSTWLMAPESLFAIPGGGINGVENAPASFLRRMRVRLDIHGIGFRAAYDF